MMIFIFIILSGKLTDIPAGTSKSGFYNLKFDGLILFIGIVSELTIENELIDFFSAILIGVGIGLLVGSWKNRITKLEFFIELI